MRLYTLPALQHAFIVRPPPDLFTVAPQLGFLVRYPLELGEHREKFLKYVSFGANKSGVR